MDGWMKLLPGIHLLCVSTCKSRSIDVLLLIASVVTLSLLASTRVWAAGGPTEGGRSCYGDSCRDKIMQTTQCFVATNSDSNLRSLPSEKAQAVGSVGQGEKVYVADRQPGWMFVQASESQNGGWISSVLLTKCGPSF